MKKIAIFVEGQTERIFVEKLINEYLTYDDYDLESIKMLGDSTTTITKRKKIDNNIKYYFLIFDVVGDGRILSQIIERSEKLINENQYSKIIGLRDFFPHKIIDKEKVFSSIKKLIQQTSFSEYIKIIFAIMEIEAWFLAEYTLFQRIDSVLTVQYIKEKLKIDLIKVNPENIKHPSGTINKIYQLINKKYKKREKQSYQICYKIDYAKLCFDEMILNKINSFKLFIKEINNCL
ncbi:MAG: DUF4276 family protein [Spirochaetes bacterium]|nr:DUF4276 family protein [Spirochaetota bacterium]